MATRKKQNEELESQLLGLLKGTIGGMDKKIAKNTRRIDILEDEVFPKQPQNVQQLPSWWRDPALIKLFTLIVGAAILILFIIASLKGIKLPGIF